MPAKKTAQSSKTRKTAPDPAAFAEMFFQQWQAQWQDLLQQGGMPSGLEQFGLSPGFIPLQQIGPMGLMAPMGAVAMANLKLLQDLQNRVAELEKQIAKQKKTKSQDH